MISVKDIFYLTLANLIRSLSVKTKARGKSHKVLSAIE